MSPKRQRLDRKARQQAGLCRECGEPRIKGSKAFCKRHLELSRLSSRKKQGYKGLKTSTALT